MAIEQIPEISSVLAQMRSVSAIAAAGAQAELLTPVVPSMGFAAELGRALARVSAMQNHSSRQAKAFELGEPDIALHDVIIDMQKAGLAFHASIQLRNRLVAAYQEIASMPV